MLIGQSQLDWIAHSSYLRTEVLETHSNLTKRAMNVYLTNHRYRDLVSAGEPFLRADKFTLRSTVNIPVIIGCQFDRQIRSRNEILQDSTNAKCQSGHESEISVGSRTTWMRVNDRSLSQRSSCGMRRMKHNKQQPHHHQQQHVVALLPLLNQSTPPC